MYMPIGHVGVGDLSESADYCQIADEAPAMTLEECGEWRSDIGSLASLPGFEADERILPILESEYPQQAFEASPSNDAPVRLSPMGKRSRRSLTRDLKRSASAPQSPERALPAAEFASPVSFCMEDLNDSANREFNSIFGISDMLDLSKFEYFDSPVKKQERVFLSGTDFNLLDLFKEDDPPETKPKIRLNIASKTVPPIFDQEFEAKPNIKQEIVEQEAELKIKPKKFDHFSMMEKTKIEKLSDTEEFVDVENMSDEEPSPMSPIAIAATSVDSLLQQFEAAEELSRLPNKKTIESTNSQNPTPVSKPKTSLLITPNVINIRAEHDYCMAPFMAKYAKKPLSNETSNITSTSLPSTTSLPVQSPVKTTAEPAAENIQNIIVFENGVEKVISVDESKKFVSRNSVLKNNVYTKVTKSTQNLTNPNSLLKPKQVSVLKTNYNQNNHKTLDAPLKKSQEVPTESSTSKVNNCQSIKKKLNLNEYKKRRGEAASTKTDNVSCARLQASTVLTASEKNSTNIQSVCKSNILQEKNIKTLFDPIAEAAKKALKLKKGAKKSDNIDKIVMSKIPKVNNLQILPMVTENGKLLPMIKNMDEAEDTKEIRPRVVRRKNSQYVEIVMVSIGVGSTGHDLKKSELKDCNSNLATEKNQEYHGEDKVIVHRMKDIVKPEMRSIETQTDPPVKENYCQIDNPSKVRYNDLINRWRTDPVEHDRRKSKHSSSGSVSSSSQRSSRNRSRNYRRSNDSAYSYSRNPSFDSSDSRSIKSLPHQSKRKRTDSVSSNEFARANYESDIDRRRRKISRGEFQERFSSPSSHSMSSRSSSSSIDSFYSGSSRSNYTTCSSRSSCRCPKIKDNESEEERKIVYVGMIESSLTISDLKMKFLKYGRIQEVSIHRKKDGTRFGFVTFPDPQQTYTVIENFKSDPDINNYDVNFGGRRLFCKYAYEDLDDLTALHQESNYYPALIANKLNRPTNSFDNLLEEAKLMMARKTKSRKLVYA